MNMEFRINSNNIEILNFIFRKYLQIERVIIYGSRAKGNFRENSDVDLIITNSKIDRHDIGKILSEIDDSNFSYIVDLQDFNTINNRDLIDHINRVGKTIYSHIKYILQV
jgi:predicted nucleotidyltransferase